MGYLGDREFIGKDWFAWLIQETIPFYVRIKKDVLTKNHRGKEIKVSWLFYHLKLSEKKVLKRSYKIYTHPLYVSGSRAPTGELMMVVSNVKSDKAIEIYYTRWEIETLFQCLKSRGFNFEATHMTKRSRIKKLIVLLAIAFCWAHKVGEWRILYEKPIKLKKHGRKAKSIFRYGLDLIQDALSKVPLTVRPIMKWIKILFRTIDYDFPSFYLKKQLGGIF